VTPALSLCIYLLAGLSAAVQAAGLFRKQPLPRGLAAGLNGLPAVLLLLLLLLRSVTIGFPALTGSYESLLFYALCVLALAAGYDLQRRLPVRREVQFTSSLIALALLLLASSPLFSRQALPPVPALRSAWLLLHVSFAFLGEAFFVFSFITSLMVLIRKEEKAVEEFDRLTYSAVMTGFPLFTLGALIFGAVWAEAAWGRFWSWDPKETWALITWMVYAVYLHFRLIRKSARRLCAWLAVAGFLCTVFTFFGVNWLLGGLHGY